MRKVAACHGKVMIAGEYSVLYQGRALASTVTSLMKASVSHGKTDGITITSSIWAEPKTVSYSELKNSNEPAFHVIDTLISQGYLKTFQPIELEITNENFDVSYGIGSSAAVRIAILKSLSSLLGLGLSEIDFIKISYLDQLTLQGKASGYDIITQTIEGCIESKKINLESLDNPFYKKADLPLISKFNIYIGGKGAPTAGLVKETLCFIEKNNLQKEIFNKSESLIGKLLNKDSSQKDVIDSIISFRDLFKNAPSFPHRITQALTTVPGYDTSFTWKTTGAGGEDAILLFGEIPNEAEKALKATGYKLAPFTFSS